MHGPCFSHHRRRHLSSGGAETIAAPAGASTPLVHGTSAGIGPVQISSLTAHGQILRGAWRMIVGYVLWPSCGSFGCVWLTATNHRGLTPHKFLKLVQTAIPKGARLERICPPAVDFPGSGAANQKTFIWRYPT